VASINGRGGGELRNSVGFWASIVRISSHDAAVRSFSLSFFTTPLKVELKRAMRNLGEHFMKLE
jgi:hypothetical protein